MVERFQKQKALIVALDIPNQEDDPEFLTQELGLLLLNLNISVASTIIQKRLAPDPAFLIGRGKVEEIATLGKGLNAQLLVSIHKLNPIQLANLGAATGMDVWDRTLVIMKIFEVRAHTSEAKLQVELARCRYELPHLKGLGKQMSRLGAGIGTRGPGETEFERHRRKLNRRIRDIMIQLKKVQKSRFYQRKRRSRAGLLTISLVGYTNSGKSTLLKYLSKDKKILVANQLFSTLDTFVRAVRLPCGKKVLLADTVGFIRQLPPGLIAAFRTTLEEVSLSDLILLILDVSSADVLRRYDIVEEMLGEIGAGGIPRMVVLNKIDLVSQETVSIYVRRFRNLGENVVALSALTGERMTEFLNVLENVILPISERKSEGFAAEHDRF